MTKEQLMKFHQEEPSEYDQQAREFLEKTGAVLDIKYHSYGKHFDDDENERDIYECTLSKGQRKFTFKFGNSVNNSGIINAWGIKGHIPFWHNGLSCYGCGALENVNGFASASFKLLKKRKMLTEYSVLAGITFYDPGSFENFCSEFGYSNDSIKAKKTYDAVVEEWRNVQTIFSDDEIEMLQEIQ